MALTDIFLIILFLLAAIKGYMKGFVVELFSFLAFFLGLLLAVRYTTPLANWLFEGSSYYQFFAIITFIALFISILLLINLLGTILKKAINITLMGFFDNLLGAIAGVLKWMIILSLLVWVFDSLGFVIPPSLTEKSAIFPYVEQSGPVFFKWLSKVMPFVKDAMDSLNPSDKAFT